MKISKAEESSSMQHCDATRTPKMQQASSEKLRLVGYNDGDEVHYYEYDEPLPPAQTTGQLSHTHHHHSNSQPHNYHYNNQNHHHHKQHPQESSIDDDDDKFVPLKANQRQQIKPKQISIIRPTTLLTTTTTTNSSLKSCSRPKFAKQLFRNLFNLLVINVILSNLEQNYIIVWLQDKLELAPATTSGQQLTRPALSFRSLPRIILAGAIECQLDGDCLKDKICHENRCICHREKPIEDQDRCLSLALLNEQCSLSEQCLGNSVCIDGICSCGNEGISLFNPSAKIYYCHPKRKLNQECNYDSQCPENAYCSTKSYGCLCQNGYAQGNVSSGSVETLECLAKFCTSSSNCENEFYSCDDNKCKCVATHYDPTTSKCYKFGSTGGKELDESNATSVMSDDDNNYSIFRDLTENSDKLWLVLIILISLSILILVFIFMLVRKHYLGYCWTAHKKEYEPNTKTPPKNGYFNKSSINNKSFRKKNNLEVEDGEGADSVGKDSADDLTEATTAKGTDRSILVASSSSTSNNSGNNKSIGHTDRGGLSKSSPSRGDDDYIRVNMNDNLHEDTRQPRHYQQYQLSVGSPLKTSTSTPV